MARLLTVVNERKRLVNEYRKYLEDQYIGEQKAKDHEVWLKEREEKRARGEPVAMTPDEVVVMLKARAARKNEQLKSVKEAIMSVKDDDKSVLASNITEDDVELLATTKVKLTQKDILRSFVGNWATLTLK